MCNCLQETNRGIKGQSWEIESKSAIRGRSEDEIGRGTILGTLFERERV